MRRIRYIVAAATFVALLLVFSVPGVMAAAPSEDMGSSMGPPSGAGGSYQGGNFPQGSSPGYKSMGESKPYGYNQPPPMGGTQYGQPAQRGGPPQSSTGGDAFVIGVDQPDNCLRIRKGPSTAYEQVGCAKLGAKLRLTGVFSNDNRWAQLDDNGWVFVCQIKTDLKPPGGSFACGKGGESYEVWSGPAGYFSEDVGPTYLYGGYSPYWYGHRWRRHGHHGHHSMHSGHGHRR